MSANENSPSSAPQNRRGSFTTQTFNSIFGRSNSTGGPTAPFPGPISTAAANDQRRRMSITTLGLSGSSPTQASPFPFGRRASVSDRSDSIDESAIDDDDSPRRPSNVSFTRRMSVGAQALRARSNGGSPGASGRSPSYTKPSSLPTIPAGNRGGGGGGSTPPQAYQASMQSKPRTASDFPVSPRPGEGGGFNWSEQLRSRAESSVSQSHRPSFSTSPTGPKAPALHDRARSVEMQNPPLSTPAPTPPKPARKQPDAFQERILKGDFYMD